MASVGIQQYQGNDLVDSESSIDETTVETEEKIDKSDSIIEKEFHQESVIVSSKWSSMFSTAVGILKFSASVAPRHVGLMRMVTDHSIPSLLLPSGIHLQKRVVVTPGCPIHPKTLGEIYTHKPKKLKHNNTDNKEEESETSATEIDENETSIVGVHHGTTVLYAHGGAYCLCSSATHRRLLSMLCIKASARIVAVNYRRPPEHPHSACVLDIMRAYLHLIENGTPPQSIVFAGDSAGGGLCVSALVALRDAGRPLPAGAALMSPWVDLSDFDGGTWGLNSKTDFLPQDLAKLFADAVIGEGGDAKDPSISPAYADLSGLPPLCIEAGGSEVLLSQISKFTAQATLVGVDIEFKASPGMVHVFQLFEGMGQPEPGESLHRIANFITRVSLKHGEKSGKSSPYGYTITEKADEDISIEFSINIQEGPEVEEIGSGGGGHRIQPPLKHQPKPLGKLGSMKSDTKKN
mmetsp:Transcript_31172/g.36718  ORF Transcript_31172/g.36718 Transcript_31172/m.36718 type:complete len:464 (+) Transcript_31172:113-1504(+)